MIDTYEGATLMLDGKPLATAARAEIGTPERTIAWTQPIACDALDAIGKMFGVERHEPVRPSGTATFHIGGILRVVLPIAVTGADPAREDERGTTVTMHAEADPKAWRRAVSMAVEQAIRTGYVGGRDGYNVACRAMVQGTTPTVRAMGYKVAHGRGCAYRGERKRRKAMRRLLRAAGVTVQR